MRRQSGWLRASGPMLARGRRFDQPSNPCQVMQAGISGISAVISPDGAVTQRTELFEQAIVRAELPLIDSDTPYTRLGDLVGPAALALAAAVALWLLVADRTRKRRTT